MQQVTVQQVRDSLTHCMDPEVPLNIVEMGLVYGIEVTPSNDVYIKMTMTTQGCPLHQTLVADVTRHVKKLPGVNNVQVDIVWDPPWSIDKMSEAARAKLRGLAKSTPAPINYDTAMPQGVGSLIQQEDGGLVLANEHNQGFMVNQAIVDFWKSCNGKRKITELVEIFSQKTGLARNQIEKEVIQLVGQLLDAGLIIIPDQTPNVEFKK